MKKSDREETRKTNAILEEINAAREKLLSDAGGDVHQYLEGVREREAASGRLIVSKSQRAGGEIAADAEDAVRSQSASNRPLWLPS